MEPYNLEDGLDFWNENA